MQWLLEGRSSGYDTARVHALTLDAARCEVVIERSVIGRPSVACGRRCLIRHPVEHLRQVLAAVSVETVARRESGLLPVRLGCSA